MSFPGVSTSIMRNRNKQEGFGTSSNPDRFANQDYLVLKKACLMQRLRYVDEMFPPDKNTIGQGLLSSSDLARVEWLRPAKISPCPAFISDGVSRFDFGQGLVSDCWFLAAIGALTFQKKVLDQVVPVDQEFNEEYCGLFHFRFWRFGSWIDVVIDDKLPTMHGKLLFVRSKDPNEFWPALLEKAYAKVCGSYMDMNMGTPEEAMMDFTGGVHMCIQLSDPPADMWQLMLRAANNISLMGCGTPTGDAFENTILPNGVVLCHAYTVSGVKQVESNGKAVRLLRLWNPWGGVEWNGDWSDKSPLWETVTREDRDLCLKVAEDGEFWMTLEDFCECYVDLDICSLYPNFLDAAPDSYWKASSYDGRWVAGTTAGGCIRFTETFWTNPQFRIRVSGSEEDVDKNMLVSVMQRPDKRHRRLVTSLYIGFAVFKVTDEYKDIPGKFPAAFFSTHAPVVQSVPYFNSREVMKFFRLTPGDYLIVPTTYNPNETASFLLTIYSREETHGYDNSGNHNNHQQQQQELKINNGMDAVDEDVLKIFKQHCNKYEEIDSELLQKVLNENIFTGMKQNRGLSLEACRSIVALMDTSITGTLNCREFVRLWKKVKTYKEVFFRTDVSETGTLSLQELRNAITEAGVKVGDKVLNLLALRYGATSGHITLENFITLIIRLNCMYKIYNHLSDGRSMSLNQAEWMCLSMYT